MEMMIPKKVEHIKSISDIKDVFLKTEIEILLNNWCVQKTNDDYIFFKHFETSRKGVVYQLILSGNEYDGLYEMEVFGKHLKFKNAFDRSLNEMILKIETNGNYDLATFDKVGFNLTLDKTKEFNFKEKVKSNLNEMSKIDIIEIETVSGQKIKFEQKEIGEIKFRTGINKILKKSFEEIEKIHIFKKKRPFHISRIDLGEHGFKEELIKRKFITLEEYEKFTSSNISTCTQFFENFKKVEII